MKGFWKKSKAAKSPVQDAPAPVDDAPYVPSHRADVPVVVGEEVEAEDDTPAFRENLSAGLRRKGEKLNPPRDMRETPVDNPLDYREDGSIQEGDPAWNFMQEVMESGAGIAVQREDGTWSTEIVDGEK